MRYDIINVIEPDFFSGVLPNENTFPGYNEAKHVISGLDVFIQSELQKVFGGGGGGG